KGKDGPPKRLKLACLFCRERKIGCNPSPAGDNKHCDQCTKRSLACEMPDGGRRGQYAR
ncbi:hypothetical protein PENSPDRAFT_550508, partial [Peniophora sp. CONT]